MRVHRSDGRGSSAMGFRARQLPRSREGIAKREPGKEIEKRLERRNKRCTCSAESLFGFGVRGEDAGEAGFW